MVTGEKDGDGDEESSNGADACGRRVLQEILNAVAIDQILVTSYDQ